LKTRVHETAVGSVRKQKPAIDDADYLYAADGSS
jgi:hypothetical protein